MASVLTTDDQIIIYKSAVTLIEDAGEEAEFRPEYSGRGMYGKTRPAIVTGISGARLGAFIALAIYQHFGELDEEMISEIVPDRYDSMANQRVYY